MDPGEPREVSDDPFFGEVRRRHPDVDLVLLPPETADPPAPPPVDPTVLAAAPDQHDTETRRLWSEVTRGVEPTQVISRWVPGEISGTVRRETLLAAGTVDPGAATAALDAAAHLLEQAGWHVLQPDSGLPRVLAGHGQGAGRRELQVVHVPATGRYAMTSRGPSYTVGAARVPALLRGTS